jgi:hypothetical protein
MLRVLTCIVVSIVKPTRCTNVPNLFYFGMTLHVSGSRSIHHQEFKTVHTATGICQTDTTVCLLANRQQHHQEFKTVHTATKQILLSSGVPDCTYSSICLTKACCCMYSLELLVMDGNTVRNV